MLSARTRRAAWIPRARPREPVTGLQHLVFAGSGLEKKHSCNGRSWPKAEWPLSTAKPGNVAIRLAWNPRIYSAVPLVEIRPECAKSRRLLTGAPAGQSLRDRTPELLASDQCASRIPHEPGCATASPTRTRTGPFTSAAAVSSFNPLTGPSITRSSDRVALMIATAGVLAGNPRSIAVALPLDQLIIDFGGR